MSAHREGRTGRTVLGAGLMLATLALTACGGGGGSRDELTGSEALERVPASAEASTDGFVQYLEGLTHASEAQSDRAAPLSLEGFEPPTSEQAEPEPLG